MKETPPSLDGAPLVVHTLVDGEQAAEEIAEALAAWLAVARRSPNVALYGVRPPGAVGDTIADTAARGVRVRIACVQQ